MTKKKIKDMAASVHEKLLNRAQELGKTFNELLQFYVMERFLFRLSKSSFADSFVLKGGLLLVGWQTSPGRSTLDIDFLGHLQGDLRELEKVIKTVCNQDVKDDGLSFDPDTVHGSEIIEDSVYPGIRLTFRSYLGNAQIPMRVDVGFGDTVIPRPVEIEYPTILNFEPPHIQVYTKESTISEKFETMVKLGARNSRMKDFYDIWLLAQRYDFDGATLSRAIQETFKNRDTPIPGELTALAETFVLEKQTQWEAFLRRGRFEGLPVDFLSIISEIGRFLKPVARACAKGETLEMKWRAPGPWR